MSHTQAEIDEIIEMERLHLYNQGVPCGPKAIQARLAGTEGAPAPSEYRIKKVLRERDLIHGWTRDYPREQQLNR